jgi:hypothetical protein
VAIFLVVVFWFREKYLGATMLPVQWTQHYAGMKVIVSDLAVERKVKHRAVAVVDVRRPNKVKPIYKLKRFETVKPIAYMVKGVGLIVHPTIYKKLQEQMSNSIKEQERKMFFSTFGG